MARPKAHVIGDRACDVFSEVLPAEWVKRRQNPDYNVDFKVDVYERGKRTGLAFDAQVKGVEVIKTKRRGVAFSMEVKDIEEYADRIREPVFLFVVDVNARAGNWLFMQRYIDEEMDGTKWRRKPPKAKVTVHLPPGNALVDSVALRSAIDDAAKYMAERNPVAVEAAMKADVKKLEAREPRVRLTLRVDDTGRHYTIHPKETIPLRIEFSGDAPRVQQLMRQFIEQGLPTEVRPGELKIHGSPLFDALGPIVKVEAAARGSGTATLRRVDGAGQRRAEIPALPFTVVAGTREGRITTALPDDLVVLTFVGEIGQDRGRFDFRFNLSRWNGVRVLDLPFFDECYAMFGEPQSEERIEIDYYLPGRRASTFGFCAHPQMNSVAKELKLIASLRDLVRHVGINPPLPERLSEQDATILVAVEDLRRGQTVKGVGSEASAILGIYLEDAKQIVSKRRGLNDTHIRQEGWHVKILREPAFVPGVRVDFTHGRVVESIPELRKRIAASRDGLVEVTVVGTRESQLTIAPAPQ